jgi:hypothetical protein
MSRRRIELDQFSDLLTRWKHAREAAGRARATVEKTERELLDLLGEADEGTVDGRPAICRDVEVRPGIDLARLREEHPELWEQYPTQRRRTRLKFPHRRTHL